MEFFLNRCLMLIVYLLRFIHSISQAVCHSENIYLIQVDSTCSHIYFSGHERDDFFDHINSPTSIVIRYEKFLHRLYFTIYIPERPLRIELSDTKLSRIKGWFIINRDNDEQKPEVSNDDEDDDDDEDEDEDDVKCYPVYQQSLVQVYTKFYRTTQSKI
jgi:transmembrane protein 132